MNQFDVRALGWVLTQDTCAEALRVMFGGRRRTSPAMLLMLGERWREVQSSVRADRSGRLDVSMIIPLAAPLSKDSQAALVEFIDRLEACYPDLYSEQVLRSRCLGAWTRCIASAASAAILANFASSTIPIFGDAALVLLVIAGFGLLMTIRLWRTHRLVKGIHRHPGWSKRMSVTREAVGQRGTRGSPNR